MSPLQLLPMHMAFTLFPHCSLDAALSALMRRSNAIPPRLHVNLTLLSRDYVFMYVCVCVCVQHQDVPTGRIWQCSHQAAAQEPKGSDAVAHLRIQTDRSRGGPGALI